MGGLIVQGHQEKNIRQQDKECVIIRHEDFGRQLVWAFQGYVSIMIEGPEESFFNQQQDADAATPGLVVQQERNNNKKTTQSFKSWYCAPILTTTTHQWQLWQFPWLMMTMSLHQRIAQLPTKLLMTSSVVDHIVASVSANEHDRIPSTTPDAEPPRDARDSGSARSHSTHLETSSSDQP